MSEQILLSGTQKAPTEEMERCCSPAVGQNHLFPEKGCPSFDSYPLHPVHLSKSHKKKSLNGD